MRGHVDLAGEADDGIVATTMVLVDRLMPQQGTGHGGSSAMVAVAVTVMSGSSAPIIGTSVWVTWLTVTVTVSIDDAGGHHQRTQA